MITQAFLLSLVPLLFVPSVNAAPPPIYKERAVSAEPEMRVCTLNLHLQDRGKRKTSRKRKRKKEQYLIERIVNARCDVIAVQEVSGASNDEAYQPLQRFTNELSRIAGREFVSYVGDSLDERIRNGFLVGRDVGKVTRKESFTDVNLPKLQVLGKSRRFVRGPFLVSLKVPGKGNAATKEIVFITMHLKSKSQAWKDPTETKFEALRIEMAEALRQIARREKKLRGDSSVVVVLGDRNSDHDSASAQILAGARSIKDFFPPNACVVDDRQRAVCPRPGDTAPQFVGLLELQWRHRGEKRRLGSYRYKGELYLLDEILVDAENVWMFRREDGSVAAGFEGSFRKGSDHKLLWAELNW